MERRRQFLKFIVGFAAGAGTMLTPFLNGVRSIWAEAQKTILPKNTRLENLIGKNPAQLDTRNLEPMPLESFQTMGLSDLEVDPDTWRLQITGRVKKPLNLTYPDILQLGSIEREVLLICPGVFANYGRWKGISMPTLLETATVDPEITHAVFSGPQSGVKKSEKFSIEDVRSNRVFLAYGVNGETLPKQHGFPLRLVAEGFYGFQWVKYVEGVSFE
jgi:sulfoxide reductase catalytic subunit YedY